MRFTLFITSLCFCAFAWAQDEPTPSPLEESREDATSARPRHQIVPPQSKANQIGMGAQIGFQSGLTVEYWTAEGRALNAALSMEHGNIGASVNHLWMFRGAFPGDANPLVPYVGIGALAVFGHSEGYLARSDKSFVFAAQLPLGAEFLPEQRNWTLFAEVLPSYEITPQGIGFAGADAGFRYYF